MHDPEFHNRLETYLFIEFKQFQALGGSQLPNHLELDQILQSSSEAQKNFNKKKMGGEWQN